jgi:hypothetical protein
MIVLGISGRKQSGKTTAGNFILSLHLSKLGLAEKVLLDDEGQILLSDFGGNKEYEGLFQPHIIPKTDINAQSLLQKLYSKIKIYNFADVLKQDICMNILGLEYNQCYGSDDEKNQTTHLQWENKQLSGRDAMQIIGTDIFRKLDPDVWVKATISKIVREKPDIAIITDCRFPNEVESIQNIGGKVLRLTRNPHNSDHLSESILDKDKFDWSKFDYVIDNVNSSIYDQVSQIKTLLENLLGLTT